ncbi:hypothetical protein NS506_06710 [Nocardia seriolae]|uniref:2'-5' RNA ligase family protein n=1 Tax=Nocardia seriolae TaxID=37332 RepID=A0ABC8B2G5_9NOCA|nr:2'-5' RNA ligase family protein [Nocardia seriolae]APB00741.1 hypothetical protein NS506_06710 [Nocardia seriolae]
MSRRSDSGGCQSVEWLRNHWARPVNHRAYYWFLTFENALELHSLAKHCQGAIDFPYYDPTPPDGLHMTLDRIAYDTERSPEQIEAIRAAAAKACSAIGPVDIDLNELGGTRGAVGFNATPTQRIRNLRDALRSATLSVCADAPVKTAEFHPHVTIAYANADGVSAADATRAVAAINTTMHGVRVTVAEVAMVLLERRPRSYSSLVVYRIPLAGTPE